MYLEAIYLDSNGDPSKTGVTAEGGSDEATKIMFESARLFEVRNDEAEFMIDLYSPQGEILDTIYTSGYGYEKITGEPALSEEYYVEIDENFWAKA